MVSPGNEGDWILLFWLALGLWGSQPDPAKRQRTYSKFTLDIHMSLFLTGMLQYCAIIRCICSLNYHFGVILRYLCGTNVEPTVYDEVVGGEASIP